MSLPAYVLPQDTDIYACCGNMLELKGGSIWAEGVSIILGGKKMIDLAKLCTGINARVSFSVHNDNTVHEMEKHYDAAERFYQYLNKTIITEKLQFFPDAVALLCEVFHSMDRFEMIPWTEYDDHLNSVDAKSCLVESLPFALNKEVSSPLKKMKCTDNVKQQIGKLQKNQEQPGDFKQNQITTKTDKRK